MSLKDIWFICLITSLIDDCNKNETKKSFKRKKNNFNYVLLIEIVFILTMSLILLLICQMLMPTIIEIMKQNNK